MIIKNASKVERGDVRKVIRDRAREGRKAAMAALIEEAVKFGYDRRTASTQVNRLFSGANIDGSLPTDRRVNFR